MGYSEEEIAEAQKAIDFYPDTSSFWDSSTGQEVLDIVKVHKLKSTNTNRERCRLHAEAISSSLYPILVLLGGWLKHSRKPEGFPKDSSRVLGW